MTLLPKPTLGVGLAAVMLLRLLPSLRLQLAGLAALSVCLPLASVLLSGIVAVTLSPVMSSRFVHEHGEEGRLTALVNRGFEAVKRVYGRLLDGALQMRWAIVVASLLVMLAAWPLYTFSRKELALFGFVRAPRVLDVERWMLNVRCSKNG